MYKKCREREKPNPNYPDSNQMLAEKEKQLLAQNKLGSKKTRPHNSSK